MSDNEMTPSVYEVIARMKERAERAMPMDIKRAGEFVLRSTTGDLKFTVLNTAGERCYGDPVWVNRGDRVLVSFGFDGVHAGCELMAEITAEGKIVVNEQHQLEEGRHDFDDAGHGMEFARHG
jgi:hypothetical protein